ncbi:hypothetical protein D043_3881A, partial [Vibrio parahaemolyticus EKP-021]
MYVRLLRNN